jgi:hypothetical protein
MTYEFPEAEDQAGDARGELINYSYYELVICYSVRGTDTCVVNTPYGVLVYSEPVPCRG